MQDCSNSRDASGKTAIQLFFALLISNIKGTVQSCTIRIFIGFAVSHIRMNWFFVLGGFSWTFGGWAVAKFVDPAALQLYLVFTAFAIIIANLGERRGGTSAYSVFNENCRPLMGELQAEQFDNEVRHRTNDNESDSPQQRRSHHDDHAALLESTRREIFAEERKARHTTRIPGRPRRHR